MELENLITRARAAGVTMMIMDGGMAACWCSRSRRYIRSRHAEPAEALRQALLQSLGAVEEPPLLIDEI